MSYDERIRILFEGLNKVTQLERSLNSAAEAAEALQVALEAANDELAVSKGRLSTTEAAAKALARAQRRYDQPRTASGKFAPDPERKKRTSLLQTYALENRLMNRRLREDKRLFDQQNKYVTALGGRLKALTSIRGLAAAAADPKEMRKQRMSAARAFASPVIRENYATRTTSIAERQILASTRLGSQVGLSASKQKIVAGKIGEINEIVRRYKDLTEKIQSGIVKDEGALAILERARRSLATALTSQVEELREIRRTSTGSKDVFDRATRIRERAGELESTLSGRGITSSQRRSIENVRSRLESAIGYTGSGNIEASKDQLDAAERLISKLERAETRRAKAERARNKVIRDNEKATAKSVSLANQETKARERLLDIENKIRAGKRISIEQAADLAFFREPPSPSGGAGGRSQLMLPAAAPGSPLMSGGARRRRGAAETMLGGVSVSTIRESIAGPGIIPAYLESVERPLVEGSSKVAAKAGKASSASFAKAFEQATPLGVADKLLGAATKAFKSLPGLIESSAKKANNAGELLSRGASGKTLSPAQMAIVAGTNVGQMVSSGQIAGLLPQGDPNRPAVRGGARRVGKSREFIGIDPADQQQIASSLRVENFLSERRAKNAAENAKAEKELASQRQSATTKLLKAYQDLELANKSVADKQSKQYTFTRQIVDTTNLAANAAEMLSKSMDPSVATTKTLLENIGKITSDLQRYATSQKFAARMAIAPATGGAGGQGSTGAATAAATQRLMLGVAATGSRVTNLRNIGGIEQDTFRSIRQSLIDLAKQAKAGAAPIAELSYALENIKAGVSSFERQIKTSIGGFDTLTSRLRELGQGSRAEQTFRGGRSSEQSISEAVQAFNQSVGVEGTKAFATLADLADPARASINQLELFDQILREIRGDLKVTDAGFDQFNKSLRRASARIRDQLSRRDPEADTLTRRLGARGAQGASEALIGGAFPLLFGQGAFASLGGGLGGGIGGFIGGSLGFGLSLLGTAVGQAADSLIQAAKDTGAAYKDVVANFDAIKESSIISSSSQEQLIEKLIEGGKVATAYSLIQSELNAKIGPEGVSKLQDLATASDRMGRAVAELGMQLQVFVAGPVTSFLNAISGGIERKNLEDATQRLFASLPEEARKQFQQELRQAAPKQAVPFLGDAGSTRRSGVDFRLAIPADQFREIVDKFSQSLPQAPQTAEQRQKIIQQNAQQAVSFAEDRLQSLNLTKEIQGFGQQYSNQIRAAQREQDDANRQSFEIRRDYEQQIGEIRLGIEDRIRQTNIENRQKEIAILQKQGQILEASFANASASLRANLAGDELAISLADAVDTYLSSQLSAQNEIENRRRQFEFEIANQQLELEKYKIDVAKSVSKLNVSTAERVRQINLNIARRNEDVNAITFNTEKEITLQRLAVIKAETEQARIGRLEQLQMLQARPDRGTPVVQSFIADLQKTIENLNKILSGPTSITKDIERIQASRPQRLSQIPGVPTQGVDFSGVDATAQRRTELSRQFKEAEDRLTSLLSTGKFIEFNNALRDLAVSPAIQRQTELTKAFRESAAALGDTNPVLAAIDDSYNNYINNNLKKNTLVSEQNKEAVTTLLIAYRDASKELEGLAETQKFYIDTNSGLNSQLADTRDSINQLLQPTSQYERLLSIINASGGISVNQAENERILELARNVDTLNTKLKQLNFINDVAGAWTDSFIGFNKELIKTGNLGKSIEQWAENIADRSIDLALEFILRPIQEQMFKDVANFLGFEAQNPQLKALSSIDQTLNELKKVVDFAFSGDSWKNSPQYKTLFDFGGASTGMGGPTAANSIVPGPSNTSTEAMSSPAQPYQAAIAENRLWESAAKFVPLFDPAANSINVFNNSVVKAAEGLNYFTSSASTAAAGAGATPSDTKVSESMEKFSRTIGSGIQVMSGIAMAYGGARMIGKGGIFNTLMGLSSVFGGISSLASGISKFPGFANGGRPTPGEPAWIGEEGMELWVPDKPGTIVPMDDIYIPGLDDDGPAPSINGRYSRGANSGSGSTGVQGVSALGSGTAFGQSIPYQRSEFSREVERIDQVISNPGELPPVKVETQAINSLEFVTPQQLEESSNKTAQAARRQTIRELADSLRTRRGIGIQ